METVKTLFWGAPKSLQMVTADMKLKDACSLEAKFWTILDSMLKSRDYFTNKGPASQSYGFSSGHVWMWQLDYKESWGRRINAFELWWWRRLLGITLDCKEIQPVHPNIHRKDWCWSWNSNILATCCKEPTHLKRPWCWERLKVGTEGGDREWDC